MPRLLMGKTLPWETLEHRFDDDFISIGRQHGVYAYMLARALKAQHIVEFGTSFGISTIYLACAVRDNGGGRVIGTERVAAKAERARDHRDYLEWVRNPANGFLSTRLVLDEGTEFSVRVR